MQHDVQVFDQFGEIAGDGMIALAAVGVNVCHAIITAWFSKLVRRYQRRHEPLNTILKQLVLVGYHSTYNRCLERFDTQRLHSAEQ